MSNQSTDPRIAKKEIIVTRNKSAQQKHQLREKDRSMAKLTQLLKTPTTKTYKNLKKKPKTPEKRSTGNKNTVTNNTRQGNMSKEYYPDKLRRKFEEKRRFLKPKYKSHMVVKLNKRKLATPQRGSTLEGMQSQSQFEDDWSSIYDNKSDLFADLSMEEVVRIVEETESLDDEDLMEILTCPSPVWWEDPPDEEYIEEAIFTRKPERMQKTPNIKKSLNEKPKNLPKKENKKAKKTEKPATTDFINIKTVDRFLKKRSKLENVLGNIKNKVNSETKNDTDDKSKDDITKESNAIETTNNRKEKRNSESTESFPDLCFNNEEMLRDLENMDIPVEIEENKLAEETILEDKELYGEEIKRESDIESVKQNESLASNVPLNLPRLTKRPKLELQESPSVKSISDETESSSLSGQENIDTISDTNIKFIIDDDVDNLNENKDSSNEIKKKIDSDVKPKANEDVLKALDDKKEYITVYKIVTSDTQEKCGANKFKNIPEYSSYVENLMKQESGSDDAKCNGQLNSFFKKCKFVNRKKKKEVDAKATDSEDSFCDTCEPKKCITVAQDENVKYCLNCSSIFDTDDCSYCIKSQNGVMDEIENQA